MADGKSGTAESESFSRGSILLSFAVDLLHFAFASPVSQAGIDSGLASAGSENWFRTMRRVFCKRHTSERAMRRDAARLSHAGPFEDLRGGDELVDRSTDLRIARP